MATRKSRHHLTRTREKLKQSLILERLIAFFCDAADPIGGKPAGEWTLTPDQIRVGLKLTDKFVPDLKSIEQTIEDKRKYRTRDDIDAALREMGFNEDEIGTAWTKAQQTLQ